VILEGRVDGGEVGSALLPPRSARASYLLGLSPDLGFELLQPTHEVGIHPSGLGQLGFEPADPCR
jgi:hypothetical protein